MARSRTSLSNSMAIDSPVKRMSSGVQAGNAILPRTPGLRHRPVGRCRGARAVR
ncbi:hypothetical protein DM52_2428 [Burkholderia mallei]|nr:hypothetical protein DM52_2428 [Burkholderia mallei]